MTKKNNKYTKVLFRYHSNVLDETTVETMWAIKVDEKNGIYKLDSIPFYGPQIATDDEFFAEYDELEQMLTYRKTTKFSGNSIVLISIIKEGIDKEIIREEFKSMNCTSEGLNDRYFSMEILASSNYLKIKTKLEEYENQGIFEYAEPCLSDKHRNEINN
ncbi:protein of unknown function [Tenacibaculum sp. MAR_2010_89]|uniref:DUF4265 domain-containing protein n=1 Tax=Tenacibaculum sp. MAR_2010_89 TaxID=1250198 RepID=UPI00089A29DD|nr:DUF4265 domain-containing protein [Tenacibaculum sp. MAR_2010_89]SED50932.1 protein of unknown function [Tenacibaculum sp. MAR_2010_89]